MSDTDAVRRRHHGKVSSSCSSKPGTLVEERSSKEIETVLDLKHTFWLTRIVLIRYLAFIYVVAFLVAVHQNRALIGSHGLLPNVQYLKAINSHYGPNQTYRAFLDVPTLLIFVSEAHADWWMDLIACSGLVIACLTMVWGASNMIAMFVLWLLYHSLVNIGQRWYSFGWESQLLESGFLAIFLCPLLSTRKLPVNSPPSMTVIWGYRWLIFRIMLGAGLIKIRGDKCWRDLTCMNYHYETQPVPNPVSYYLHQTPEFVHKFETLSNHLIELVAPVLLLLPRPLRLVGGAVQVFFQIVLIISGNLSFLNWLTILPALACFDDAALARLFPDKVLTDLREVERCRRKATQKSVGQYIRRTQDVCLAIMIAYLSIPVVQNLVSSKQAMNTSFDSFRIVNTYGAFGSVTKTRTEVIIQGTRNKTVIPDELGGLWKEYEFKCKPGDVARRPCIISPYHYRLDWLMWFAAFMNYNQNPWLIHLVAKLLANDRDVSLLLAKNPFDGGPPPRYIRGEHYLYEFTRIGSAEAARGDWWKRKRLGSYFPVVDLEALKPFLKSHEWPAPRWKKDN